MRGRRKITTYSVPQLPSLTAELGEERGSEALGVSNKRQEGRLQEPESGLIATKYCGKNKQTKTKKQTPKLSKTCPLMPLPLEDECGQEQRPYHCQPPLRDGHTSAREDRTEVSIH